MIISKVSKGSVMDQIYIPKRRAALPVGSYVIIKPIEAVDKQVQPSYYNIRYIEPIKVQIIKEIFKAIEADNVVITGSFLDKGFRFNDADVLIITEDELDQAVIKENIKESTGVECHLIAISNNAIIKGLETDPLYRVMLSRCVSKSRFIYKVKPKINYKILDLHLLKSSLLIDNFEALTGNEKYDLVRNFVSIYLFEKGKRVTKDSVDSAINHIFGDKAVESLKNNTIGKNFLSKYKEIYLKTQKKILDSIKNEQE